MAVAEQTAAADIRPQRRVTAPRTTPVRSPALNVGAVLVAIGLAIGFPTLGVAQGAAGIERGHQLLLQFCSRCHAVEKTGESPNPVSPPFRTLHERYPVEYLEEALGEGISVGHPEMPEFKLEPVQIGDVIDYLKSLER